MCFALTSDDGMERESTSPKLDGRKDRLGTTSGRKWGEKEENGFKGGWNRFKCNRESSKTGEPGDN